VTSPNTLSEEQQLKQFLSHITLPQKEKTPDHIKRPKVIVIAGPTCVGKTKHSLIVAKALAGEVVSADSMQVYREMDIGTAKVSEEERKQVPHHLIDIRDLTQTFNVVDFYTEAMRAIRSILARDRVPVVVGGTGFYLHALIYGPPAGPPSEPDLRAQLEGEMDAKGPEALFERLAELDPDYAATITKNDKQKIVRGLEIISLTNDKVSRFKTSRESEQHYDFRCWFLHLPREILYPYIEMRCDEMIAAGLIDEVKELSGRGLENNLSASQAIGYRQCLEFLKSGQSHEDFDNFVNRFKQASRQYAKRQFTWFKREPLFRWLNIENIPIDRSSELIIQDYELSF